MTPTLIGEHFSPWTEKARWALDHHGIRYAYREHVPLLGELPLRVRARRLTGRVSVPLLTTEDGAIGDSFAIARHAEGAGGAPRLFPAGEDAALTAWNARSETALAAARALYLERFDGSRQAKLEAQPAFLPNVLRRAALPAVDLGVRFLRRKYRIDPASRSGAEAVLSQELDGLRAALSGRPYLLGSGFTYADITMAVTLQFVAPVDARHLALGPGTRAASAHPTLAARYPDLLAWRDALYARHRESGRMRSGGTGE